MLSRSSLGKSPIDPSEYAGLQVDTRARDNKDPFLDVSKPQGYLDDDFDEHTNYMDEKQAHASRGQTVDPRSPVSPQSPDAHGTAPGNRTLPPMPQARTVDGVFRAAEVTPEVRERRICGLKKKHFWEMFGLVLALIIAAAVVGGVVGGLQAKNTNASPPAPNAAAPPVVKPSPTASNTPILSADILADSPIKVISYDAGGGGDPDSRQSFRVYYQSVIGNVKEAVSSGQASWQNAAPIFTDALNNTGLATVTYLNGTQQQGTIFYVGMNGLIQEKRKIFNNTLYWEPGTINNLNLAADGNITLPPESAPDLKSGIGSYPMAAVYSQSFSSGAGIRLFYHAEIINGTSYVQEMVWIQAKDSWTKGAQIPNVWPNSKLAATIDDSNGLLRLFFTSGNQTLQELYCDINDMHWEYQDGIKIENYLARNTADLSAISVNGTTYIYHHAAINQTANTGIHELAINGVPGSSKNLESYNLSEPLISSPQLTLANSGQSAFQPLAASKTIVPGVLPRIFVFWADQVTGDPNALSGYRALSQTSRHVSNSMWPTTRAFPVPLGSNNSQPSKRSLRSWLTWILRL